MHSELASFYGGKAVLVTGHTGFKGGWLALWLQSLGARVAGYALEPQNDRPSFFDAARVGDAMASTLGDVRDLEHVTRTFTQTEPEIVFHLAAQALVRPSYRLPLETLATNVVGTANVLEAARQTPSVRAIVVVTSDKCYEEGSSADPFRETDRLGGRDPYSCSKACAELVAASYRESFFRPQGGPHLATARAGNVIGGGDWGEDRLVPDFVRRRAAGQPLVVRRPSAVRPWQYVLDPLHGYLLLAKALCQQGNEAAEAWNFGPDDQSQISVEAFAERLVEAFGDGATHVDAMVDPHLHETGLLTLDSTKARRRLGWTPKTSLDRAIEQTVAWYRQEETLPKTIAEFTLGQLEQFHASISNL